VYVINQALSVEQVDSVHYNQVASKEMHLYFKGKDPYLSVADMNVYVNYFIFDDDSLMVGMNNAETSQMKVYMKDRKLQKIWMPESIHTMYPPFQIPSDKLYLDNFSWFDYVRPIDKDDIFNWRPKKTGTELKESVRHAAPKQKLSDNQDGQQGIMIVK
jgi:hypothetical protein